MPFHDTLKAHDRRLAMRMEGLGDVVVGFAMSQLVIALPQVGAQIHVRNAASILAYFGTFAVLVILWLNFHRMMSTAFVPRGLDLGVAFAYLAFTSLMPYAMNTFFVTERGQGASLEAYTYALSVYAGAFFATFLTSSIIWWRNLRRGWYHFDDDEREMVWMSALRNTGLGAAMLGAWIIDITRGPELAGYSFFFLFVPLIVIRRFFRKPPAPAALRIPAPDPAA